MCLLVKQGGFNSLESFQTEDLNVDAEEKTQVLQNLVEKVCEMLAFTKGATMHEEEEDKRDVVLLLFVRFKLDDDKLGRRHAGLVKVTT